MSAGYAAVLIRKLLEAMPAQEVQAMVFDCRSVAHRDPRDSTRQGAEAEVMIDELAYVLDQALQSFDKLPVRS